MGAPPAHEVPDRNPAAGCSARVQTQQWVPAALDPVPGTMPAERQELPRGTVLALQRTVGNAAVAALVMARFHDPRRVPVQRLTATEIIEKRSGFLGSLDEDGLGRDLGALLPAEGDVVVQVFARLDDSDRDDVAFALASSLTADKLASLSEDLRMILVRELVHGVVTDDEEGQIARIWDSFGPGLGAAATRNDRLWKLSLEESDQLNELPAVRRVREGFRQDVKRLAGLYLDDNERGARREAEKFGIKLPGSGGDEGRPAVAEPGYVEDVQALARQIQRVQQMTRELRQVKVGYRVNVHARDPSALHQLPAFFDPEQRPQIPPDGSEQPALATWDQTKTQHDRLTSVVRGFANLYPSIYVLLAQDRLGELTTAGSAEQAKEVTAEAFRRTLAKIAESREMLRTGDIAFYDLVALHSQLFDGRSNVPFQATFDWADPFNKGLAKGELAAEEARQFWTKLGLSLVAAAALIAAPFTGGASAAILVGIGVGIGAGQAADSWERYLDLSAAADATVRDELALVSEGQVTGALVGAVMDTASVFMDAFGARAATAASRAAARAQFEVADKGLRDRMAREARARAVRGAVGDAAMTAAGAAGAVVDHELFGEEPEIEATGQVAVLDAPAAGDGATLSRVVVQRNGPVVTGQDFEAYVDRGLRRGDIRIPGIPEIDFIIPGQYTGSGWGIDRIGIAIDPAGRVHMFHFEMKMQQLPSLGTPGVGTQTGGAWTSNAIEGLLTSQRPEARAARERLRRAMQSMYPGTAVDISVMRTFLEGRLRKARVVVFVPHLADLQRLWRQIGGLIRHGRRVSVVPVRLP